jgi:predicted DNA-binding transcriptional regulator YafY
MEMQPIKVQMRFLAAFAHLAQYARGYWESLEEQPDGSVVVTFSAPDVYAAASNALAYGPAVIVLEPGEVRQIVKEWAQTTSEFYP